MRRNRAFTLQDVKKHAGSLGYELIYQRYKRLFTLRKASNPRVWGWVYFPDNPEVTIELVDDLSFDQWKIAIEKSIKDINSA